MKKILSLIILALMLFSIVSCDFIEDIIYPGTVEDSAAWENATYLNDKEYQEELDNDNYYNHRVVD